MKNKIKITNMALVTGIASVFPYCSLATEKESLLNVDWNTEFIEGGFENFESIAQTSDGGFIVSGEADVREEEGGSRGDGVIVKYNRNGEQEWYNALVGEDTDLFYGVCEGKNDKYYAIGKSYSSDLDFTNTNNLSHAIIVKYDNEGTQEWIKAVNDNGKQINYRNIISLSDGHLAIVGDRVIDGKRTGFLMIIDENGDEISFVKIEDNTNNTEINNVIETKEGKLIVIGKSILNSEEKPFISQISKDGKKEWSYNTEEDDNKEINKLRGSFTSVVQSKNGDIIVSGYCLTENQNSLLMTFDEKGDRLGVNITQSNTLDKYTSVMLNSKGEVLVLGESTPDREINLLEDLNISVARYDSSDYTTLIRTDDLSDVMKNVSASKSIITSEDKIILVGKTYKKVIGQDAKCDVTKAIISNDCIQADGVIMQISVKSAQVFPTEEESNPCEINEKPIINADDIVIHIGEEFNPLLNVTATDKENGDLTNSIKINSNNVDVNKVGEYKVVYTVADECGLSVEKERTVTVKAKTVDSTTDTTDSTTTTTDSTTTTTKPQTGDEVFAYVGLAIISILGLLGINQKKEK